jgi:hypothetical protein
MTRYDHPDDVRLVGLKLGDSPYREFEKQGKGEVIDVELITSLNYANLAKNRLITASFYFCDQIDTRVEGLGGLPLYYHDKTWIYIGDSEIDNIMPSGFYQYHAIMSSFAHEKPSNLNGPEILDFDLREAPRDICFYIDATTLDIPSSIRSNVVRIPKEVLVKLFAEHPRRPPSAN